MDPSRHSEALRAAQMYYLQDLTMDAIARELRTSRSTVSRLLSSARESGLVQIQIRNPLDTGPELEGRIRQRYGVDVHVVPVLETLNDAETLDRVAMQAARTIGPVVDSNAIIGVAWGSTLSAVSRHLTRKLARVDLDGAPDVLVGDHLQIALELRLKVLVDSPAHDVLAQAAEEYAQRVHDASPAGLRKRSTMAATRPQRSASAASCRSPRGVMA